MVISAVGEAKKNRIPVARTHSASSAALHRLLQDHVGQARHA